MSVVVPSVAVAAASYKHGDTVAISGSILVDGQPAASEAVTVTVTDPSGTPTEVPNVATGADGTFAASYQVPPTETPGTYTVSAAARGQTATATFTRNPTEISYHFETILFEIRSSLHLVSSFLVGMILL